MSALYWQQAVISFPFFLLFYWLYLYFLDITQQRWRMCLILSLLAFIIITLCNFSYIYTHIPFLAHVIGLLLIAVVQWKVLRIRWDYTAYGAIGVVFMSYWLSGFLLLILAIGTGP